MHTHYRATTPPDQAADFARSSIAAIIPVFNEAGRVGRVLSVLRQVTELAEILVVDDGSTDNTAAEVQQAATLDGRMRCLELPGNRGKGGALFAGAHATAADLLLFLDGDLIGLQRHHVPALIGPVASGQADMAVGLFRGGRPDTDFAHRATPWLSGQRCVRRDLFLQVDEEASAGYGVETALTLAARSGKWRLEYVGLQGVSHPPSEMRRGLWRGAGTRSRMYGQILRAWRVDRKRRALTRRSSRRARRLSRAHAASRRGGFARHRSQALSSLRLRELGPLPLAGVRRLLVVGAHPDDETIGVGGVIQAALSQGAEVKVVVLTNGDGQALAPLALRRRLVARPADYVTSGVIRESETVAAMGALGVPASSLVFLGYPDRLLEKLWLSDWSTGRTFRSKYARRTSSPYPSTHDSGARYCGRDVLDDLRTVIDQFRPDSIVVHHPNDAHPDHRAASNFCQLALGELTARETAYCASVWAYLVHYGRFPRPRGVHPEVALLPPARLSGEPNHWVRADLTPEQVQAKRAALQAYTSQLVLLRSFLPSFSRRNELFAALTTTGLEERTVSLVDVEARGSAEGTATLAPLPLSEPVGTGARRRLLGVADLVGVGAHRAGGQVWVTAHTRAPLVRAFRYRLLAKLPTGQTVTARWPGKAVRTGRAAFSFPVNLALGDDPAILGFAAEVRRGGAVDRTGWHFVTLQGPAV